MTAQSVIQARKTVCTPQLNALPLQKNIKSVLQIVYIIHSGIAPHISVLQQNYDHPKPLPTRQQIHHSLKHHHMMPNKQNTKDHKLYA